jgi:hypothetical protein
MTMFRHLNCRLLLGIASGDYELAIGIVEPSTGTPVVRLAIADRDASGGYPVSRVGVAK